MVPPSPRLPSLRSIAPRCALLALLTTTSSLVFADPAQDALAAAERAVATARERQALWLTAAKALTAARAALARGDAEESVRQSERARELAELGILQSEQGTGPR